MMQNQFMNIKETTSKTHENQISENSFINLLDYQLIME
jgi:hypothetical protein